MYNLASQFNLRTAVSKHRLLWARSLSVYRESAMSYSRWSLGLDQGQDRRCRLLDCREARRWWWQTCMEGWRPKLCFIELHMDPWKNLKEAISSNWITAFFPDFSGFCYSTAASKVQIAAWYEKIFHGWINLLCAYYCFGLKNYFLYSRKRKNTIHAVPIRKILSEVFSMSNSSYGSGIIVLEWTARI